MVNKDFVVAKLAELAERVQRVRDHAPAEASILGTDRDTLDIVAFNLMLCVQTCADLASHLIADEGWPAARNMAESFGRLHEQGVLSQETANTLKRAVGLRNVVAHGYAGIDVEMCHRAATAGLDDLDAFARELSGWIGGR